MMKRTFTYGCVSSETGEASTLSQLKKPNRLKKKKKRKLVLRMQQHTLIPKRRHLVLKETFLAKHCLLVLRIHANFSSLFSSPLPTTVKNVCCKNTQCWLAQCILPPLFFSLPLECSVFIYRKAVRVKSKELPFSLQS